MLQLHAKLVTKSEWEPRVLRIATNVDRPTDERHNEALLLTSAMMRPPHGFAAYLVPHGEHAPYESSVGPLVHMPIQMGYLNDGDVVWLRADALSVLYRRQSAFNALLVTERCNSNCIMCSQPPKNIDDGYLVDVLLQAIPLLDVATPEIGFTGGEPTLLGDRFLDLIRACKTTLPKTTLHVLSNGRLFAYLSLSQEVAAIGHPDLMLGIPLYSDIASRHDFVVQAKGAFDQTIRGIMNLERCGVRVELRVVLHRHTVPRLASLARFIARNAPFVEHVALMGLEMTGYVRKNLDQLWIDPVDYQPQLREAIGVLDRHGMHVSIYNHQLCTLDRDLWRFSRQSISDWKNEYLDACSDCVVRDQCGGFFSSASIRHSRHIRPITDAPIAFSLP